MTNEELIKWAKLEQASNWIWHASKENLDALIWIAKQEARAEVWKQIAAQANMEADARLLTSYPGGLLKRKKDNG
jgi:hypothetical protein